ncbi:MAG: tetratricopeptide repeat protein, partial [Syntrophobacteraceae bacterium]|nr:tetratricopeptide repeat protein [Syntrophobacteraceae bacterium]
EVLEAYAESLIGLEKYDEALQLLVKARESLREGSGERVLPLLLLQSKCHQELKQLDRAIELLEDALKLASSDEQKSQLSYELSRLYLAAGKTDKASQRLSQLLETSQSFWKTAAQQQLESIKMAKPK